MRASLGDIAVKHNLIPSALYCNLLHGKEYRLISPVLVPIRLHALDEDISIQNEARLACVWEF